MIEISLAILLELVQESFRSDTCARRWFCYHCDKIVREPDYDERCDKCRLFTSASNLDLLLSIVREVNFTLPFTTNEIVISIYLSRGWSAVINPSRGFSKDWDVTTDQPRLGLICRGQTTGNKLFFSYPCPANKHKTKTPEVRYQTGSTRQKNLALHFRSDFLVWCTRISISTSQTFRSWVFIFNLRWPMAFLSLSLYDMPGLLLVWMFHSEGQATFQ